MSECALPGCSKEARRKFCSNRHKDRYHNLNNPRGKFAHLKDEDNWLEHDLRDDDFGHSHGDQGPGDPPNF